MQVRYTAMIRRLAQEFPEARHEFWPQTLTRWMATLDIRPVRKGWYDEEDYQGLQALGEAYRRHQLRGQDALDYVAQRIDTWRNRNGY